MVSQASSCSSKETSGGIIRGARLLTYSVALLALLYAALSAVTIKREESTHDGNLLARSKQSSSSSGSSRNKTLPVGLPRRRHGVLCFGDSLTAGMSGPQFFPYAIYLQETLDKTLTNGTATSNTHQSTSPIQVQHVGKPGWTAKQFLEEQNHPERGLRTSIRNWPSSPSSPRLDLVIILAGTNDLGRRKEAGAEAIAQDIVTMHKLCYQNSVPRTIVLEIPSSLYQTRSASAAKMANSVNKKLKAFAEEESRATFVEFPFGYDHDHAELWYRDGLHFSEKGYQFLGQYLERFVLEILNDIDKGN